MRSEGRVRPGAACPFTSPSPTAPPTATTGRSRCRRRPSGCGRRPTAGRPILGYSLRIAPETHFLNWLQDPHGNYLARAVFPELTRSLEVTVDLVAEIAVINPFDFFVEPEAEQWPFAYEPALARDLAPFRTPAPPGARLRALIASIPRRETRTLDFLVGLNQRLAGDIGYIIRMEPGVQPPDVTLEKRTGSCRDTGWLLVELLRHLGFAARFVSGYLIQLAPDVKALDGPSGTATDFTDLHAWAEVYIPGAGWIGLDPTSGLLAGEGHIPLVCTPQPESAAPISGAVDECEVEFSHHMAVQRVFEAPRVTKPYTEEEWARIDRLGEEVDAALRRGDVRLTMGGEPTFVSIDDPDGAEWNTAAMGPRKRLLAGTLLRRLKARFAPGGLLHYGQGKWYPGEPLPRWALGCWWRADGEPIWHDDALIADESQDLGHETGTAQRFVEALAARLGVEPACVVPGYEDVWYYLWKERRLPVNLDPLRATLDDAAERRRLARLLERGLSTVVGYALPLARREDPDAPAGWRWRSGPWSFRSEHLFLLPGDSPMGYRLPLDSLPWIAEGDRETLIGPDPFEPRAAAAVARAIDRRRPIVARGGAGQPTGRAAGDGRRTAGADARAARRRARSAAASRRIGRRDRAHRALRRAARGAAARVPAAGPHRRGLPRSDRGDRSDRRRAATCR